MKNRFQLLVIGVAALFCSWIQTAWIEGTRTLVPFSLPLAFIPMFVIFFNWKFTATWSICCGWWFVMTSHDRTGSALLVVVFSVSLAQLIFDHWFRSPSYFATTTLAGIVSLVWGVFVVGKLWIFFHMQWSVLQHALAEGMVFFIVQIAIALALTMLAKRFLYHPADRLYA